MKTSTLSNMYGTLYSVMRKLPAEPTIKFARWAFKKLPIEKLTDYDVRDENLKTTLRGAYGDLELDNPVILAAGYDDPKIIEKALKMGFSAVTVKVSKDRKEGNKGRTLAWAEDGMDNSIGYKNDGTYEHRNNMEKIREEVPDAKMVQNISDDSISNYIEVIEHMDPVVDAFEINNCLNSPQSDRLDFFRYPEAARDLFMEVRKATKKPLILKLPRAEDFPQIYEETIPMALDNGFTILNYANTKRVENKKFRAGTAGRSGPVNYTDTFNNAKRLKKEFGKYADIIATGGIGSALDAEHMLRIAGADAISFITEFGQDPFLAKETNEYLVLVREDTI